MIFVGGVSQLYQGDLDFGRVAVDELLQQQWPPHVVIEHLHYGAVAVVQRLEELPVETLILVGAHERGRRPGTLERRRIAPPSLPATELQKAVGDAVTGYVNIDLVVEVSSALGALASRTVAIEAEPARIEPSDELSGELADAMAPALELVEAEIRCAPLFHLAEQLRPLLAEERLEDSDAAAAMRDLVRELGVLDAEGRWGATFALRDRVKLKISQGATGEGMTHLDWGLWWMLLEELDRIEALEADAP